MQNKKNNKVGFRTYRKKMAAMLLVGMLAVSTAATGCGKKDVDYDVDGNGGSEVEATQTAEVFRVNMVFLRAVIHRSQQVIPVFRRLPLMQKR